LISRLGIAIHFRIRFCIHPARFRISVFYVSIVFVHIRGVIRRLCLFAGG